MFYEPLHSSNQNYFSLSEKIGQNFSFPLHLHENYELVCVTDGVLRVGINDQTYDVRAGEVALILPNQPHEFETPAYSRCFIAIFSSDHIPELKNYLHIPHVPVFPVEESALYDKLSKAKTNPLRIRSVLYEIAARYMDGAEAPQSECCGDELVCKVVAYIDKNYRGDMSLLTMSHALGYSYRYMSGVVNRFFKMPLPQVVNRYRVNDACLLLLHTDKTVTDIALACGFGSVRNFNRNFKNVMGVSPAVYKNHGTGKVRLR